MDLLAAYVSDTDEDDEDAAVMPSSNNLQARKRIKLGEGGAKADKVMGNFQQLPSADDLLSDLAPADLSTVTFKQHTLAAPLLQLSAPATTQTSLQVIELCASLKLPPEPPRIRNFPHVEGNFATTVYITADAHAQAKLSALTSTLLKHCGKTSAVDQPTSPADLTVVSPSSTSMQQVTCLQLWPTFPWKTVATAQEPTMPQRNGTADPSSQQPQQLPIHMSVSRTVPIRRCQIESLQAALVKQLKAFKACRVCLHGLVCLVNDSKTRSFVGLRMSLGEHKVVSLIKAVDKAFVMHGLQTFYQEPLPHVSLAWGPGDMTAALKHWLDSIEHEPIPLQVRQVVCQVGKLGHVVWQA